VPDNAAEMIRDLKLPAARRGNALVTGTRRAFALTLGAFALMAAPSALAADTGGASPTAGGPAPSATNSAHGNPASRLEKIAQCESGGDPTSVSKSGVYRGKYQFSRETWRSMGGHGDPARAPETEQDRLAARLMATQGPSAWPNCS